MTSFPSFASALLLWAAMHTAEPTIWGIVVERPSGRLDEIYRDAQVEFHGRNYGTAESPQVPALFVRSVRHGRWAQIQRVSTRGGKFGYFPFDLKVMVAAPWDFRRLAKTASVELPLGKGHVLHFPAEIQDRDDFYLLLHDTNWNDPRTATALRVSKEALLALFK